LDIHHPFDVLHVPLLYLTRVHGLMLAKEK
jgi:hypothetical protein